METPMKAGFAKVSAANWTKAFGLVAIGVGLAAAGIYVGDTDDAPGAALLGILSMIGLIVLGVRLVGRNR